MEDPSSPLYNTITKRSDIGAVLADDMRGSPFYRSGLFVDYPSDGATRRGSCILIHIWSAPDKGNRGLRWTAGSPGRSLAGIFPRRHGHRDPAGNSL